MFIAAVLTIIGYSINDTIVTFDMIRSVYKKRIMEKVNKVEGKKKDNKKNKEEKKKLDLLALGFNDEDLIGVVNDSVRITFFRSILTTITTIFPVICLMVLGAREIVNFNIALFVGFIAGVYSSIYISNQIWLMLETRSIKKPKKEPDDDDEVSEIQVKGVNC